MRSLRMINKSFLFLLSRLAVIGFLVIAVGCQKREEAVATPQTITDRILEDSQFNLFRSAVAYAGVGDALKAGNMTLFAPNDAAFQASGISSFAAILAMPQDQVRSLVLYHLLYGRASATAIPAGLNSVQMASQSTAFINKTNDGSIYVNNAKLTQTDIVVANGYIHVVDRLLNPATGNLLTTVQNNPNLTFLSAALKRISASNPSVLSALNATSVNNAVTVFAPSDAAFRADKTYNSLSAIETANVQTLTNTLLYHVVSGVLFSNQLQSGSLTTLLSGNKVTVTTTTNQITLKGNKNATAATIKQADLPTTNGVIHIIDQVLLP